MIDYSDTIQDLYPDGATVLFEVTGVKIIKITHPNEDKTKPKKEQEKVDALRVSLKLQISDDIPEIEIVDIIPLIRGRTFKIDHLRTAVGEEVKTRIFDEESLVGQTGFAVVSEKDERNYISVYLAPSEGEERFQEQLKVLSKETTE